MNLPENSASARISVHRWLLVAQILLSQYKPTEGIQLLHECLSGSKKLDITCTHKWSVALCVRLKSFTVAYITYN